MENATAVEEMNTEIDDNQMESMDDFLWKTIVPQMEEKELEVCGSTCDNYSVHYDMFLNMAFCLKEMGWTYADLKSSLLDHVYPEEKLN
ncbi:MAG: hypothetical protein WAW75_07130 [Gallionella sp.]